MSNWNRRESVGYMMAWAARLIGKRVDRELKPLGLTAGYLPVLFSLVDGSGLTTGALAEVAAIEQPTMTMTLARMERDGLVERRTNPTDRRGSLFYCTAGALEKAVAAEGVMIRVNLEIISLLPPDYSAAYLNGLQQVVSHLSEQEELGGRRRGSHSLGLAHMIDR